MDTLGRELRSWAIVAWTLFRYILYRLGLGRYPTINNLYDPMLVIGRVLGWHKRLRIVGAEHCPKEHPAVFCTNHFKLDDPFVVEAAIHLASDKNLWVVQMMRDDFFPQRYKTWLYDPNELLGMLGTRQISRSKVTLSQMKEFVELLRNNQSLLIFPGRSRSRSGLFMEYREDIQEPGSPSFLVAQVQRLEPARVVRLVPVARSYNPATQETTVAFGPPVILRHGADRHEQRALDFQLIETMSELIEIHVPHIVSGILYLRCLHKIRGPLSFVRLREDVGKVIGCIPHRLVASAATVNLEEELHLTLKYLESKDILRHLESDILTNSEAILFAPPLDTTYRDANPVRFLVNQILHLPDLTQALTDVVFASDKASV